MKKLIKGLICAGLILVTAVIPSIQTRAQEEENRILTGVYVEEMSLEGKTKSEAKSLVETYVESLSEKMITLIAVGGNEVQVKVSDLGLYWSNQEIIDEAVNIGQTGNVVQRYKTAKDLQYQNKVYRLEFGIDQELVKTIIREQCAAYNMEAADATLTRENDRFVIIPGQTGEIVD